MRRIVTAADAISFSSPSFSTVAAWWIWFSYKGSAGRRQIPELPRAADGLRRFSVGASPFLNSRHLQ